MEQMLLFQRTVFYDDDRSITESEHNYFNRDCSTVPKNEKLVGFVAKWAEHINMYRHLYVTLSRWEGKCHDWL